MAKWATSLFLILTLAAGVLAGMPLHAAEEECMHGMSGMDCCKAALGQGNQTEVAAARVCCAVNCPQSGTTGPLGARLPRTSIVLAVALHPAAIQLHLAAPTIGLHWHRTHSPPQFSNPSYIRNLALLI
ncbi:MAG: hypothetical protein H0V18_20350 [Pyrinomonadaceae bacterium]|nr:hypothetical protein [Pyrinomonadaceae bacterium]